MYADCHAASRPTARRPLLADARFVETDVLIAGGGLAGIACAMALRDSGLRVTLAEAGTQLGGRARSWRDETTGDAVDIGPHVITTHHHNFLSLVSECGASKQIVWQPDPLLTLFDGHRPLDMHLAPLPAPLALLPAFTAASHLSLRARLSNLAATREAMRFLETDVTTLDRIDAESYLLGLGVAPSFIDWFWRSMCMAILNVPLERCSAAALVRCYTQLCGHRKYCFGFPSGALGDLFIPGTTRLLADAGTQILTEAKVERLEFREGRFEGAGLAGGRSINARSFVCALPPAEAAALLPGPARWPDFEPSRYFSVYLWFDRKVTDARFWTRVWSPDTVNYDFYDLSSIRAGAKERGSLIASNIIHAQRLAPMSDAAIVEVTLKELREFAPAAAGARLLHSRVHHVPMAVPCPSPGTEAGRPPTSIADLPGVFLAGDWTRTELPACMESAVRSGRLAAEQVLGREGAVRAIALPAPKTTGLSGWARRRRERAHAER